MNLNLLVAAAVILLLAGAKPVRSRSALYADYFSKEQNTMLRGFFVIFVIFHHMSQFLISETAQGRVFLAFANYGFLPVAVFFFYSGYGLMKKHISDESYHRHFLLHRIPVLLIPYLLASVLYWLAFWFGQGLRLDLQTILRMTFLLGNPLVVFSWYVLAILLFYFIFWALMKIFRRRFGLMMIGACVSYLLYVLFCLSVGYGIWWYYTAFSFVFGMLWAWKQPEIDRYASAHYVPVTVLCWGLFLTLLLLRDSLCSFLPQLSSILVYNTISCSFVAAVTLTTMKIKFGNSALHFFGTHSFELYLIHGLYVYVLSPSIQKLPNSLLCCIVMLSLSVFTAYLFKLVCDWLLRKYRHLLASALR